MSVRSLTGSRIRDIRKQMGAKQADIARRAGISPAYMNLIEHNRRPIGGKVLLELARALEVDPADLTDDSGPDRISALISAATAETPPANMPPELARAAEFDSRLPGWSALITRQAERIAALEHRNAALADRMAHDPQLAGALHNLLSKVTAIHATAAILSDTPEIGADWRDRFLRNLREDSQNLTENSQSLVRFLEGEAESNPVAATPQEELEIWLNRHGWHLAELESNATPGADEILAGADGIVSDGGRYLAQKFIRQYAKLAALIPLPALTELIGDGVTAPDMIARHFRAPLAETLWRLAMAGELPGQPPPGLIVIDGAGALTLRKPAAGFLPPRFEAGCPLWPVFQALCQPAVAISTALELPGQLPARFRAYAAATQTGPSHFGPSASQGAVMLLCPVTTADPNPILAGAGCRACPRESCTARREPGPANWQFAAAH